MPNMSRRMISQGKANPGALPARILLARYMEDAARTVTERKRALGARIAAARKEKRWKQKQLAAAVHVEPITVSRWERGEHSPDLDTLDRIADSLETPLSYFLPEDPTQPEAAAPSAEPLAAVAASLAESARSLAESAALIASALQDPAAPPRKRPTQ